jgi:regulator of sigma E protease
MSLLLTAVGISLLIILHELGHYTAARLCGMRVLKFSFGFGPAVWRRQSGDTTWQVAALPIGGFVQVQGLAPPEPGVEPAAADSRSFRERPRWQRALFLFAGPAANWVLAAFFIFLLLATVGFEQFDPESTVIGDVVLGKPAENAGLIAGDRITAIDGAPITSWADLVNAVSPRPNQSLKVTVERAGKDLVFGVTTRKNDEGGGEIGVAPKGQTVRLDPLPAVLASLVGAWTVTEDQARLLWGLVRRTEKGQLSGLPGIVKVVSAQASRGVRYLLQALAYLSVSLCLLNLLPIPALDGSRLLLLGIEGIRRKALNPKAEAVIHGVGFLALFALIIVVSIRDLI